MTRLALALLAAGVAALGAQGAAAAPRSPEAAGAAPQRAAVAACRRVVSRHIHVRHHRHGSGRRHAHRKVHLHKRRCKRRRAPARAPGPVAPLPAPATTQPSGPGPSTGSEQSGPPTRLGIFAREWTLTPSRPEIPAGRVTIDLTNLGEDAHNAVLLPRGGGTPVELAEVGPGVTSTATVDLPAGAWRMLCSLPGHEQAGMRAELTVR